MSILAKAADGIRPFAGASRSRRCRLCLEELERREVPTLMGNSLFPADNPWNEKITNAPVAANSATLVNSIGLSTAMHADFGTTWAGSYIGIPINVVRGTQAKINVVVDAFAGESDLMPVPIPSGAILEGDPLPAAQNTGDRHLLVYDQDNNLLYELYNASRPSENTDGQWHCDSLAFWNMNQDWFRTPGFTSADAAGMPILPGLVRPDEVLDQKVITHALRFTVSRSDSAYIFPASHDAGVNNASLPRMGERFRLKQSFDISGFSPANQVILQALKDYGMIVADNGSSWYLSGEPSTRWNDSDLHNLGQLTGNNFEAVDLTPRITSATYNGMLAAGSVVTITGLNFTGGAGMTAVKFGSFAAAQIQVVSDTQILATVGTLPSGAVTAKVTSPYGSSSAVTVLQNGTQTPQGPVLIGPSGSILNAMPTFSWNAASGASTYDIWVDDATTGQTQVVRNQQVAGTSLTVGNALAPGDSFRWWVRAINAIGGAGPWSAPGTFTVARLAMPNPLGPSGILQSASVNFTWNAVTGADTYDVWVDDVSTKQTQVLRNTQVTGASLAASLSPGHSYQWWLRAQNASGNASLWSAAVTFSIALGTPTPMGPAGPVQNATPSFSWNAVTGTVYYDLWVDDGTAAQSQVIRNMQISGASWTPAVPLAVGHSYNWWVRASVPGGLVSPWSSQTSFSVTPLGSVVQVGPSGSIQNAAPTFLWNAVALADVYDVWVNNLTTGLAQVLRNTHVTAMSFASAVVLTPGQRYQWWVRALSNNGDSGPWGVGTVFTVALLNTPAPAGPSGSAAGVTPTFTWNAITGADYYDVWVDDRTTGQSQVLRNAHATATTYTPSVSLITGHSYQWWVRAISNNGDYSVWSSPLAFSV